MLSNRLALAALSTACIAAAAGGGYLATRQNTVPAPASAATVAATSEPDAATPANPVQETEAVVRDNGSAGPATSTAPAAAPAAPAPPRATASAPRATTAPAPPRSPRPAAPAAPKPAAEVARQEPTPLDRSWPSGGAQPAADPVSTAPVADPPARFEDRSSAESERAPEPPARRFEELVVSADSVIGLQTETALTSERARVEDRVEAHVTRAVRVDDRVAIPAGAKAIGSVTLVERGGKFKERARLGIRFHTLVLDDGTEVPISTETIYRDGDPPDSMQKVGGGAVGGAILGAIIGGGKGAVLGGLAGAGGGAAVTMAGDRNAATLAAGSPLTVRIVSPVTVTIDAKEN